MLRFDIRYKYDVQRFFLTCVLIIQYQSTKTMKENQIIYSSAFIFSFEHYQRYYPMTFVDLFLRKNKSLSHLNKKKEVLFNHISKSTFTQTTKQLFTMIDTFMIRSICCFELPIGMITLSCFFRIQSN